MSTKTIYDDINLAFVINRLLCMSCIKIKSNSISIHWGLSLFLPVVLNITVNGLIFANAFRRQSRIVWYWALSGSLRENFRFLTSVYYSDRKIPKIVNKIHDFDVKYGYQLRDKSSSTYYMFIYILLITLILIFSGIDLVFNEISIENFDYVIVRYWNTMFPVSFLILCDEIYRRFQTFNNVWKHEIYRLSMVESQAVFKKMEMARLAHAHLCELITDVRAAFGFRLFTYLLFVFQDHVARVFFFFYFKSDELNEFSKKIDSDILEQVLFIVHSWIGIFLVTNISDKLTESSVQISSHLRNILLRKLPKKCVDQVILFMCQLQRTNTKITALRLFTVNKSTLLSMLMSLVTYTIVVIELSQDLKRYFNSTPVKI